MIFAFKATSLVKSIVIVVTTTVIAILPSIVEAGHGRHHECNHNCSLDQRIADGYYSDCCCIDCNSLMIDDNSELPPIYVCCHHQNAMTAVWYFFIFVGFGCTLGFYQGMLFWYRGYGNVKEVREILSTQATKTVSSSTSSLDQSKNVIVQSVMTTSQIMDNGFSHNRIVLRMCHILAMLPGHFKVVRF